MNVDIEAVSPSRYRLLCTVSVEEKSAEQNKVIAKYMKAGNIPGFRKGKAPRETVLKYFESAITSETIDNIINTTYENAVKEKNLNVYELVNISNLNTEVIDGCGMSFDVTVDLVPMFDLPQYEGIPIDNADTVVMDEKIDEELDELRKRMGTFEEFTPDTVVQPEDIVKISFSGTVNGRPLVEEIPDAKEYSSNEQSWCYPGSKYYIIPGLQDVLSGMKIGSEGVYTVSFPDDFPKNSLRGVTAEYKFKVNGGNRFTISEIDDKFLAKMGVQSLQELRDKIRSVLEEKAKDNDRMRRMNQISEFLVNAAPFELPQAALERNTEKILDHMIQHNMKSGVSRDDITKNRESFLDTARKSADFSLRLEIILERIGRNMKIGITDGDFKTYLLNYFSTYKLNNAAVKEVLKDKQQMRKLQKEALERKIMYAIYEKAKPSDVISA